MIISVAGNILLFVIKMNIFILDSDPKEAARMLCDRHLIKMILESAQLLCSPFEPGIAPYRRAFYNHPCAKWVRASIQNYDWLCDHAISMCEEYSQFYERRHRSQDVIEWCIRNKHMLNLNKDGLTPFAQAMPPHLKAQNAVLAYRSYYLTEKKSFAKWSRGRKVPSWWKN